MINLNFDQKKFINNIYSQLPQIKIINNKISNFKELKKVLNRNKIIAFNVFNEEGYYIYHADKKPANTVSDKLRLVPESWRLRSLEIGRDSALFQLPYHMELNSRDFRTELILPLKSIKGQKLYLQTVFSLGDIDKRLKKLYYQIGLAVLWGIVFHILFAIFIVRIFLNRIFLLTKASEKMARGDLNARASWEFKRSDELDSLGKTFNIMAEKVQGTIDKITTLNNEIQNELEIGKEVQENFLPSRKIIQEYKPAIFFRPFREVSGDIYSFNNFSSNRNFIFFADASGHGISAALITSLAITTLDTAIQESEDPVIISGQINNMITQKLSRQFFMTSVFMTITKRRRIEYINAGHPPPLIYRKNSDEIFELTSHIPPLGIADNELINTVSFQAKKGDKLLIYSDGLFECVNEKREIFSMNRIINILKEDTLELKSNDEIMKSLVNQLADFTDHYSDDVSAILLEL